VKSPRVTIVNCEPGLEPSTLLRCDVRLEFAPDLVITIRDASRIQTPQRGVFVGLPRRYHGSNPYRLIDFEGSAAAAIVEEARQAMKAHLAPPTESTTEVADDGRP